MAIIPFNRDSRPNSGLARRADMRGQSKVTETYMIIDAHAHLLTPMSVMGIRSFLQVSGGQHSAAWLRNNYLRQDDVDLAVANNIAVMDKVGTDVQLLSPRPFTLMHSHNRFDDIRIWVELQNDLIYENVTKHPTRFRGVAGLPQMAGRPIEIVFPEIDRCVNELGFVGVLLNPDPGEGNGTSPRLGDPYWYPLWEKLCSLDLPAHIHSAGCCGRETYDEHFATEESLAITSVAHSQVFDLFPNLKLMISHGGGSIPYQIGRWRSHWLVNQAAREPRIGDYFKRLEAAGWAGEPLPPPPADLVTFDDVLKKFYFDIDVHNKDSIELLIKTVGVDRCLFGTERPGSGGGIDLGTGRPMDDFKFTIDRIQWLTDADRGAIYEGNARKFFNRLDSLARHP
jgi:4-oxalmesaconate hydratase